MAAAESNATITPKRVTCLLPLGGPKWMRPLDRGTGDPKRVNQTCTEVVLRGLGNGLGTRPRGHPREANPGGQIQVANSGLRIWNSVTQSPAIMKKRTPKRKRCEVNLSNCSSAICCICRQSVEFCGILTGK